jgi:hypothetical protein
MELTKLRSRSIRNSRSKAGLIKGIAHETDQHGVYWVDVDRLTWAGHDFLDSARNREIWNQTKRVVAEKKGSVSFEMLKLVLIELGKTARRQAGILI